MVDPLSPVRVSREVSADGERAFAVFTDAFGTWWPQEYTWSGDVLEAIGLGSGPGALCHERGPHGFTCHWGRITVWDPPTRIAFTWQIGPGREPVPDPERATHVGVTFSAIAGGRTRVSLEHAGFERHGAAGGDYRDALASEHGWPLILARYATALG